MPRINLLPIKAARKSAAAKNELLLVATAVLGTFAAVYLFDMGIESEVTDMEQRLRLVDLDIEALNLDVQKEADFKAKEQTINKKLQAIDQLRAMKVGPALMLDELATILTNDAKRVWLTSVTEGGGKMKLTGAAMDATNVSEFQMALERGKFFEAVRLETVRTKREENVTYVEWELSCSTRYQAG